MVNVHDPEDSAQSSLMKALMVDEVNKKAGSAYRRIMKSTFIMGASAIISIMLGILRNKLIAIVLGPSGIGLSGIYQSITNFIGSVSGLGINESGVQQIAGASSTQDYKRIGRTAVALKRVAFFSGVLGFLLLIILSKRISIISFGDTRHWRDLTLLSAVIFMGGVSGGQVALIQGMQRINDLAKVTIFGAVAGTVLSIPMILFFKEKGIVYYLLVISGMAILSSWFYSKKIRVETISLRWRESLAEARPLLRLGLALMVGSLIIAAAQYLIRVIVVRKLGLSAAGLYQASTMLSTFYVGILLNAMIADYYPRLSAASRDDTESGFLVNKQMEVGMLFAVPGVLATMTFAPLVIPLFYSADFVAAVEVLRWQIFGVFLQVVSWPMGFIFRAKGHGGLFVWTEVFHNSAYLCLAWLGIREFGLPGLGMAFFAMNFLYLILVLFVVRSKYNFRPSSGNKSIMFFSGIALLLIFISRSVFPRGHFLVNVCILILATIIAFKKLFKASNLGSIPEVLQKIRSRFLIRK